MTWSTSFRIRKSTYIEKSNGRQRAMSLAWISRKEGSTEQNKNNTLLSFLRKYFNVFDDFSSCKEAFHFQYKNILETIIKFRAGRGIPALFTLFPCKLLEIVHNYNVVP